MLDETNSTNMDAPAPTPPEESNNRTFLIVGGIMAGLIFLVLVCFAIYLLVISPNLNKQKNAAQATRNAENASAIQAGTATAQAALWTPTSEDTLTPSPTNTPKSQTPSVTRTQVVVSVSTATFTVTSDPATLAAMQTQLAGQMTSTAVAQLTRGVGGQGMPKTGFFDEAGIPSLIVLALALVVVIFLARRMRKVPTK
jgi:hypothetical protein